MPTLDSKSTEASWVSEMTKNECCFWEGSCRGWRHETMCSDLCPLKEDGHSNDSGPLWWSEGVSPPPPPPPPLLSLSHNLQVHRNLSAPQIKSSSQYLWQRNTYSQNLESWNVSGSNLRGLSVRNPARERQCELREAHSLFETNLWHISWSSGKLISNFHCFLILPSLRETSSFISIPHPCTYRNPAKIILCRDYW